MSEKHELSCQCDRCRELREQEQAEQQKKQELYDPDSCLSDQTQCDHDCENCDPEGYEDGDGEDDW